MQLPGSLRIMSSLYVPHLQMEADPGASSQRAEELLSLPLQQNEALEVRSLKPVFHYLCKATGQG